MSNNNVSKPQQSQQTSNNNQSVDRGKIEKSKAEISLHDKQKFERMAKLWELYNKVDNKNETEVLAGPMDILREVGQFLVELSSKDLEGGVRADNTVKVDYSLHGNAVDAVDTAPKVIDLDKLEHVAERILASLPTDKSPEVQIKVADNILPETNITVKHVNGMLTVQIDSNNADAITLLGHQGAALQQMLESKTGESVVVELNSERIETREDSEQKEKEEQKQNNKEDNDDII